MTEPLETCAKCGSDDYRVQSIGAAERDPATGKMRVVTPRGAVRTCVKCGHRWTGHNIESA